jgi:integrase
MPRVADRQNHGTFTYRRGPVFWVRTSLHNRSLGTRDAMEAKLLAIPFVQEHLAALAAKRPRFDTVHRYAPRPQVYLVDGEQIFATDSVLTIIGADGIARQERNAAHVLAGPGPVTPHALAVASIEAFGGEPARPKGERANPDDQLLENYILRGGKNRTGVQPSKQSEARSVWAAFKALTDNKRLKDCKAADAALLVAHYQGLNNKSETVHKKLAWLGAMTELAIREGELDSDFRNPFHHAAPKLDDSIDRSEGFSAADLKAIAGGLHTLPADDQLLVRWLACTGARLSEISTVDGEKLSKDGIRYMHIGKKPGGKKTDASVRDLPLPTGLPGFPAKIDGPLFRSEGASKRLIQFLKDVGVWVKHEKVVHSFRHTATTSLRDAGYTEEWIDALLGHASPLYGKYNLPKFQEMIGKIGL